MNIINLTTGLEFLPDVSPDSYSRLQSSKLEGKAWQNFLEDVDNNMLYALSQGKKLLIYDCGSRRSDGCPRVIWQGIPLIKYTLERRWGLKISEPFIKNINVRNFFNEVYLTIDTRKFKYYKKHLSTNEIHIEGVYKKSKLDGK